MSEQFNDLFWYGEVPRLPALQPLYWPYAPQHAPNFQTYVCQAFKHMPVTTLDTYVAPKAAPYQSYYAQTRINGPNYAIYGNAPTSGVYTGVQEE